jgi:hypothetical protein
VIAWRGVGLGGCEMRLGEQRKRGRLKIKNAKGDEPKGESILAWPSLEMTRQVEAGGTGGNSVVGFSQPLRWFNWLKEDKLWGSNRDQETYLWSVVASGGLSSKLRARGP